MENSASSWAAPTFVQHHAFDVPTSSSEPLNSSSWTFRREEVNGLDVYIYLLLNNFGSHAMVSKFVETILPDRIVEESDFLFALNWVKDHKNGIQASSQCVDDKIQSAIKKAFAVVDKECYEVKYKPILEDGERNTVDWDDSAAVLTSGCSAILALIVDNRLYIANCGNSVGILGTEIGDDFTVFRVSEIHERQPSNGEKLEESLSEVPTRCFGGYGRKIEAELVGKTGNVASYVTAEPNVIGKIKLNHNVRFLLMVSPVVMKIMRVLNPGDVQENAVLSSLIIESLTNENRTIYESLESVLQQIREKFLNLRKDISPVDIPALALAYVNLENDNHDESGDEDNESLNLKDINISACSVESQKEEDRHQLLLLDDDQSLMRRRRDQIVSSAVDWSDFETHELRDTVLAQIESLKQYYRERKTLASIEESA